MVITEDLSKEPQEATSLRTTVTLDRDVLKRATEFCKSRGISFRQGLNELVRLGLLAQSQAAAPAEFRLTPRNMGLKAGLSYDNIEELIELGEGPDHR